MLRSSLIFILLYSAIACSDSAHQASPALAEFNVDLNRKNFKEWFAQCYPSHEELKWRLLGWEQHTAPGFKLAKISKKPLMLWLEDGHPLGATSAHGRNLRTTFSDLDLVPIIGKYVVAVDDFNRAPKIVDSTQGELVVFTPGGKIIDRTSATDVPTVVAFLNTALDNFSGMAAEESSATIDGDLLTGASHTEDDFPDEGLCLEVFTRAANSLDLSTVKRSPWNKDFVWFNSDEIIRFVKPIKISGEKSLPSDLLSRIINHGLLPPYAGAPSSWDDENTLESELIFKCNSIIKSRSTYLISGSVHCEQDGKVLNVQIRGAAMYDDSRDQFGLLEIVALAEYIDGDNPAQLFTTALRKVTSVDGWYRVPPKALSDYADAYYSSSGSGNPNK
jgi:hypothetical protein